MLPSDVAYKNIKDRKATSKRHYFANKQRYLDRNLRYRTKIKQFIRDLKESKPCKDCGIKYPFYIMDLII